MPEASNSARLARQCLVTLLVAGALELTYRLIGHRIVADAYARHAGTFLYNLISSPGPHALAEYLDRADVVWWTFQLAWLGLAGVFIAFPLFDGVTGRIHAAWVRLGRGLAGHPGAFLTGGAVALVAATLAIGWFALHHFPMAGDEYCYLYQANTLLAGRFSNPPHPLQVFFDTTHIIERDGRVFSVFPPGWPAILAAGLAIGMPPWILNPLLSAALFVLTFRLAARVLGDVGTAALAALILAWSSFVLMTGASYFSHTVSAVLIVATMIGMLRAHERGGAWTSALSGFTAALAVITRYYTPILCLLPLAVWIWRQRRWRVEYAWAALGAVPPLAFVLIYNHALSGHAFVLSKVGVGTYDELWFAPGTWHRSFEFMLRHIGELMLWTPPALVVAYAAGLSWRSLERPAGAVTAGFALLVVGLLPYISRGGYQYGPRFYFDGVALLAIGATAAIFGPTPYPHRSRGARRLVYLFFVSLLVHVPIAVSQFRSAHADMLERSDLYRQVERAHIEHALVFISGPVGSTNVMPDTDLTRNGIALDGSVLYAVDHGDDRRPLLDAYPDRSAYEYRFDPNARTGSLTVIRR